MAVRARGEAEPATYRDGVITALVARRGQADRVGVHLDGHFAFDLSVLVADRAGLRAGDPLSADVQLRLREEDAPYRARERGLRFLGTRDRSRCEVERRLRQAGFGSGVISETLTWLAGLGYVDDRRFAASYAAEKRRGGWGDRRIRAELAAKGVARAVIEEVLQEGVDSGDGGEGADLLDRTVRRRFAAQFASDPDAAERRLAGFLGRRGYDWDAIRRLSRALRIETAEGRSAETAFGPSSDASEPMPGEPPG